MKRKKERGLEGKKDRGVKTFSWLACPLTSAYMYQCGLEVRAHRASSAAIRLQSPKFL